MKRKSNVNIVPPQFTSDEWEKTKVLMGLSPQPANVTALVLQGYGDKKIARDLTISEPTVRNYFKFAFAQAGVEGRLELALHAIQLRDELRGQGA